MQLEKLYNINKGAQMENLLTIIGSTVLVFSITELLKWLLKKIKFLFKKKRKERGRAVLRKEN